MIKQGHIILAPTGNFPEIQIPIRSLETSGNQMSDFTRWKMIDVLKFISLHLSQLDGVSDGLLLEIQSRLDIVLHTLTQWISGPIPQETADELWGLIYFYIRFRLTGRTNAPGLTYSAKELLIENMNDKENEPESLFGEKNIWVEPMDSLPGTYLPRLNPQSPQDMYTFKKKQALYTLDLFLKHIELQPGLMNKTSRRVLEEKMHLLIIRLANDIVVGEEGNIDKKLLEDVCTMVNGYVLLRTTGEINEEALLELELN